DVRAVLNTIRTPTLILHRTQDRMMPVGHSRYMAEHIHGAKLVELPGQDHLFWAGDADAMLDEIREFLTGTREPGEPERILATVLFADIVASTDHAAHLGDHRWHELLDGYYDLARRELARFRGREIDTAGDGFFAAFDGPARAVRCAQAIAKGVRTLGIEVRARVPYRRMRDHWGEARRDRRSHRRARGCSGASRRGARLQYREGSRRGLGLCVRRGPAA